MLKALEDFINNADKYLKDPDKWNFLNINYHNPMVLRLWMQLGEYRFYLHLISVDQSRNEESLLHKHKWPSAVYILHGDYEMGVGYNETEDVQNTKIAAKLVMHAGDAYEMTEPHAVHYVTPLNKYEGTLSVMCTRKVYTEDIKEQKPSTLKLSSEIDPETKRKLLFLFKRYWPIKDVKIS